MNHTKAYILNGQKRQAEKAFFMGIVLIGSLFFFETFTAYAQNAVGKPEYALKSGENWRYGSNMVSGRVVSVTPSRLVLETGNKDGVSSEIHLNLRAPEAIEFNHLRGLGDVLPGDEVKVRYDDKFVENKEGKRTEYERNVSLISLIKRSSGNGKLFSREGN